MDENLEITPEYTAEQREEIGRIAYLLDELGRLRERGMISPETVTAVDTEKAERRRELERVGRAAAWLKAARHVPSTAPRNALVYAERARAMAPELLEGWLHSVEFLRQLHDLDGAIAVCQEALDQHGHAVMRGHLAALLREKDHRDRAAAIEEATARARHALNSGDHEAALATCRQILVDAPQDATALTMTVHSLHALGRLDEASVACAALQRVRPSDGAYWNERIRALRSQPVARPVTHQDQPRKIASEELVFLDESPKPAKPVVTVPRIPWSKITAEFLEDHWQKLILALAVLLIVVSSTVGAALVLGDRLWMAEGKCLLATAYTVMFAGFGHGLKLWGAERAGRIMRLTTLIVLPLDFALVGELPGLGRSSGFSLAVLLVDSAAMMALAWFVCRSLGISGGKSTPIALIALGMVNALTTRSASFSWGFGAMLTASGALAIACESLGTWLAGRNVSDKANEDDAPYFAFGLLVFFDLCAIVRIGGYVLGLPPTLYALPAMLVAAAAIRVAEGLKAARHPERPVALLRLAGYAFSALALALALARPPGRIPLFSGNTLATAVLGLLLYGRALHRGRQPVFLYAAFAALFLAYFGTHSFIKDLITPMESAVGRALGYRGKLPFPFRALNGLVFNALLAGLSLFFTRRWKDDRLAWHCQLIGLPLSLAACLLSLFDPLAAVFVLSGYTIAYAVATWLFASPPVAYLACAAFTGSAIAAAVLLGDLVGGARALALASVGSVLWLASRLLAIEKVPPAYRIPVVRSARGVAVVALAFAVWAVWPGDRPSWTGTAALWILTLLYLLIGFESPRRSIAYVAATCGAAAPLLTIRLMSTRLGWAVGPAWSATAASAIGLLYQGISPWLRDIAARRLARTGTESRLTVYPIPLFHLGLGLAALASGLAAYPVCTQQLALTPSDLAGIAAALIVLACGLAIASARTRQEEWLACATVLAAASGTVAAILAMTTARGWSLTHAGFALTCSGVALVLVSLGDQIRGRTEGWRALHRRPLLAVSFLAVGLTWLFGSWAWQHSYTLSVSLALTALTLTVALRQVPTRPLATLALASGLISWLAGWGALSSLDIEHLPGDGVLVMVYLLAVLAILEFAAIVVRGSQAVGIRPVLALAVPEFAAVAAMLALALGTVALWTEEFARLTVVLALGAAVFFGIRRFRREAGLVHVGLLLAWLATESAARWLIGARVAGVVLGWLALASALDGLICCGLRWWGRRREFGIDVLHSLRDVANILVAATFALGIAASLLTLDAYPTAVSALVLLIPALAFAAALDRTAWRTYAAVIAGIAAAYLTLFELGRGGQGHVSVLGVLASLLAIVCWSIERVVVRRTREVWHDVFAIPVRNSAVALAILAVSFEWGAAGPLLLASVPFLLLIKSLPSAGWLYPALMLAVLSGTFTVLDHQGFPALLPWTVAWAFVCWGLGLILWLAKPRLCARLGLPDDRGYEYPLYHGALALGAVVIGLRLDMILRLGDLWGARPWVPAALAVLALLMLKPYPHRGWVDGFVGLLNLAMISLCGPALNSLMAWGLVALTLALLWRFLQEAAMATQDLACHHLGIRFVDLGRVFGEWSIGLTAAGAMPLLVRIAAAVLAVTIGKPDPLLAADPAEWWEGVVAILLLGANLDLLARSLRRDWFGLLPRAIATLLVWWLAVPSSPLVVRLGLDPASILPLATVVLALSSAARGARSAVRPVARYGFGLSLVAVALTAGRLTPATTATLLLATAVQTLLGLRYHNRMVVGIGSVFWGLAWMSAADQVGQRFGWNHPPQSASGVALSALIAALGLIVAGGWDRRRAIGLARVLEAFAVAYVGIAVLVLGTATFAFASSIGPTQALVNVGLMFSAGSLCVVVALRWSSMPMAFAAQAAILLGYLAYRSGFSMPFMGDASAILILAGIELGVAEVANQGGRRIFALPALCTGLALPLVSVLLSLRRGWVGDEPLFVLFAAGTLYAASCGRMRWKRLGYAAAVLYNAALWVFWSHAGWRLADSPHLFIVPVGFSTILFAEANRRELGKPQVNAIRGVGLALIYLALAFPLSQTASLGAWVTVLAVSLAAIFAGIGLRSQAFLWLGLAGFILDVVYQLGKIGLEHALAKWAIMLALGIGLVLFVALNEKKRLVETIRKYVEVVRQWE